MTHTTFRPRRRVAGSLAALLSAGVLLGACGGSDGESKDKTTADQDAVAFSECMRDNGVDMPDPEGGTGVAQFEMPEGVTEEQLRTAQKKCEDKMPKLGGPDENDPEQVAEMRDLAVKFAECMRKQGIDYPDPKVENGRLVIQMGDADPNDPATQKATEACKDYLPEAPGQE
ncbi:MAG TPA: hypothetical protein VM266_11435 [Solirubrobacteraceae bacterium]|nr:hypothetical protein [Solirubrobacteraceae bacterium]